MSLSNIRKFVVSAIGITITVLTFTTHLGFLSPAWTDTAGALAGALTSILVYLVPNTPKT